MLLGETSLYSQGISQFDTLDPKLIQPPNRRRGEGVDRISAFRHAFALEIPLPHM